MSRLRCRIARWDAARRIPGSGQHAQSCLGCQAEAVRERRLRRELRALGAIEVAAPGRLMGLVEQRLDVSTRDSPAVSETSLSRRVATAGAVTATAAGAAFVMVWRRSHPVL